MSGRHTFVGVPCSLTFSTTETANRILYILRKNVYILAKNISNSQVLFPFFVGVLSETLSFLGSYFLAACV